MTRADDRRAAYLAKHPANDALFDADPARARHARAMARVYREELERATFYWTRYGVPFEPSELAGYAYRDIDER